MIYNLLFESKYVCVCVLMLKGKKLLYLSI